MMFVFGAGSLLANTVEGVNEKVLNNFQKEFVGAKEVAWQKGEEFMKVSFILNEKVFIAYYNEEGEKLALVRNISRLDLPLSLQENLKDSYSQYWITDLFEFNGKDDSAYYITIENADVKITLKSFGMSGWTLYKKSTK
jgi:hypothetical protein